MKIAIYAHFGTERRVAPHAWLTLQAVRSQGYEVIFVSNSEVCKEDQGALQTLVQRQIYRENTGLDFSMWKTALLELDLSTVDELLLTNSSVIGPLFPLDKAMQTAADWDCDFWGMTDSPDYNWHLQSYFLVFRKKALVLPAFRKFWDAVLPYNNKLQIIYNYEVGLTQWLEQAGLRWKAVAHWNTVISTYSAYRRSRSFIRKVWEKRKPHQIMGCNSPLFFPGILIDLGVPFVKASLLNKGNDLVSPVMLRQLISKYVPDKSTYAALTGGVISR